MTNKIPALSKGFYTTESAGGRGCIKIAFESLDDLHAADDELRALLAGPAVERKPAGHRERFQKWVLATEHPVLGFLDGHWLERGDDREGYANEYVQGLWVAFKQFASPPAPVAVVPKSECPNCLGDSMFGCDTCIPEPVAVVLPDRDLEAAAKTLAACMDYPWEQMPEQGRASMREHAKAVINAAKELNQ